MPMMLSCSVQACDRLRSEPRNGCRGSAAACVAVQPQDRGTSEVIEKPLELTQNVDGTPVDASSLHWQFRTARSHSEIVRFAATRLTLGRAKPCKRTCGTFPASVCAHGKRGQLGGRTCSTSFHAYHLATASIVETKSRQLLRPVKDPTQL